MPQAQDRWGLTLMLCRPWHSPPVSRREVPMPGSLPGRAGLRFRARFRPLCHSFGGEQGREIRLPMCRRVKLGGCLRPSGGSFRMNAGIHGEVVQHPAVNVGALSWFPQMRAGRRRGAPAGAGPSPRTDACRPEPFSQGPANPPVDRGLPGRYMEHRYDQPPARGPAHGVAQRHPFHLPRFL